MAFLENIVLSHSVMSNPMGWSPPGSSVVGISQARIPDLVAISYSSGWDTTEQLNNNNNNNSRGSSLPRNGIHISCIGKQILYDCTTCKGLIENTAQCNCLWNAMKWAITPEYHLVLTTFRYIYIDSTISPYLGFPNCLKNAFLHMALLSWNPYRVHILYLVVTY